MIPCIVLAYGDPDISTRSLKSLAAVEGDIQIDVLENPSQMAGHALQEFAQKLISAGRIRRYIRYDANISNNAILTYLAAYAGELAESEFAIITDCDLIVPPETLSEQLKILSAHPDVFACALRVDATLWHDSLSVKKGVCATMNTTTHEKEDYLEVGTGLWFALMRARDLLNISDLIIKNRMRFVDGNLNYFGKVLLQKKWVATKYAMGRELTREREGYADYKKAIEPEFVAFSPEKERPSYAIWNHNKVCEYDVVTRDGVQRGGRAHLEEAVSRFRTGLETDATVQAFSRGEITDRIGFYGRKMPILDSPPGLYFAPLPREATNIKNGIPHFGGDKSIIFLRSGEAPGRHLGLLKRIEIGPVLQALETQEVLRLIPLLRTFLRRGGRLTGSVYDWEKICERYRAGIIVDKAIGRIGAVTITQKTSKMDCFDAYVKNVKIVFCRVEIEELAQRLGFALVFKEFKGPSQPDRREPMLRFSWIRRDGAK